MCTEEDIPHQTKFTNEIIETWKRERKVFTDDMKVSWVIWHSIHCDPHELIFHDSMPLGVSLTTNAWSTANLTSFLGVTAHYIVYEEGSSHLVSLGARGGVLGQYITNT